jgi:CRISPR/Cas system CMR-associated protein Cmr5 small subunit
MQLHFRDKKVHTQHASHCPSKPTVIGLVGGATTVNINKQKAKYATRDNVAFCCCGIECKYVIYIICD